MRNLIIVLTVHIFATHTKLLYYINPEVLDKQAFSFLSLNEHTMLSMVFALSYSMATALVIYKVNTKWIVLAYAALDGLAVLLYYYLAIPTWVSGIYFAVYTTFLISSTFIVKEHTVKKPKEKLQTTLKKIQNQKII